MRGKLFFARLMAWIFFIATVCAVLFFIFNPEAGTMFKDWAINDVWEPVKVWFTGCFETVKEWFAGIGVWIKGLFSGEIPVTTVAEIVSE